MSKIFISYNRKSASIAKAVAEDVEAIGHTAWYDNDLSGGQAWWDQILDTIRQCDIFVFILDQDALNSVACISEYTYAENLGKPILPVLGVEGLSLNIVPSALSKIQFVDYRQQDRNTALRLARALNTIRPAGELPDSLPAPPPVPLSYLGGLSSKVDTINVLTYEEQSALIFDLQKGLADPESSEDTKILLKRLRKRRDLYATIAEHIDELLVRLKAPAVQQPSIDTADTKKVSGEFRQSTTAHAQHTHGTVPPRNELYAEIVSKRPTIAQRFLGALIMAIVGVVLTYASMYFIFNIHGMMYPTGITYMFTLLGLICGFISGTDKSGLWGGSIGLLLMALLQYRFFYPTIMNLLIAGVLPIMFSVMGLAIAKKSRERRKLTVEESGL